MLLVRDKKLEGATHLKVIMQLQNLEIKDNMQSLQNLEIKGNMQSQARWHMAQSRG